MTVRTRRLGRDCRGTTALEFAVIASVLLPMLFGTIELGLLMWTHNALQSTATLTARCAALGSCTNPAQFAVSTAGHWVVSGVITARNVTVNAAATSCNGTAGSFVTVAISSSYWVLPQPFLAPTLRVAACFPH
jgi:Flp pilus assembly protein TadG